MRKATKYMLNGLAIGAIAKAVGNAIEQQQSMILTPNSKFIWDELFQEACKGAVVGGLIGAVIGGIRDYQNSLEAPLNTDAILYSILLKVKLNTRNRDYMELRRRGNTIIQLIEQRFSRQLKREPIFMGSTERGTATCRKFDIDIGLLFFHDSFYSITDMYDAVYEYMYSLIGKHGIVEVRVQKKSVGVICRVNNKNLKIDLVPCRAIRDRSYSNAGYLCVNKAPFGSNASTYTKTNIPLLNKQKLSLIQKKIVILLKEWKHRKDLPLPSHLLENLVLEAYRYNCGRVPLKLTEKLVMVLDYISRNLDAICLRSIENSNNIITNILSEDKIAIMKACESTVDDYNYQKNSIVNNIMNK